MTAKSDCNKLLNDTIPFAEKMLGKYGEFHPFGAQMLKDGEIVWVGAYDEEEWSPSQNLIDILRDGFKAGANTGDFVATALVYDVRVTRSDGDMKSDAIAVDLDHRDSYSVTVFFLYRLDDGTLSLGEAFAEAGKYSIFPAANPPHA